MIALDNRPAARRLVSVRVLRDLSDQLGAGTSRQFVVDYVRLWDSRYSRLVSALHNTDFAAAMDVVLSIKTASQMAGAERLAKLAAEAQDLVRSQDHAGLVALLEPLEQCGQATMHELGQVLHGL
ncbi:Hpt domain-containing protein [Arthrobacter sp. 3Tela_A]|uniref:Hpt domain-containing protein n=1 Tax=Arthrobacter sp. 3Tela_A TaxID=3093743 RepID=UPI003BB6912A